MNKTQKELRKEIRTSVNLFKTLTEITKEYTICGNGKRCNTPYVDICLLDNGKILCLHYLNWSRRFKNVNEFSYNITFTKIEDMYSQRTEIHDKF